MSTKRHWATRAWPGVMLAFVITCTTNVAGSYNFICNGQPGST